LVSSWLRENDVPSTWLSLDEGDNDPFRFLQSFLCAFQQIAPTVGLDLLNMLQGVQPPPFEGLMGLLINEMDKIPIHSVLILDDFHLISARPILEMLTFLLEHMPPQMHMALLSRTDPLLPLSRLRVRNQLVDIRVDQLRFNLEEIAVFLNDVMGLNLSAADIAAMEARTEGWIAGLQLAALSMRSCADIHEFVSAFTGSHHYVMDYLLEEVLRLQPKHVSAFLLQTSILDPLCGSLCESVIDADTEGEVDGQAMLESLERMNLFVVPLDNERRWYRYHHLFADVLRKRLEHQFPHLLPGLQRRASQWYEQNGLIPEAIRSSLAARDQDSAIRLIEQNGCHLLARGELSTLHNWIQAVEPQAQVRPWVYILKAWLFALTGYPERVEEMLQIAERLISSMEAEADLQLMHGMIATARAYLTNLEGETLQAARFARQALEYLPDNDFVSCCLCTVAISLLGDASSMNGELEAARQAYLKSKQMGQAAGNLDLVVVTNSNLANILIEQGLLHQAVEIYSETLHMATRPDGQKFVIAGRVYIELSQVSYEWNRLETAAEQVRRGMALCRQWGNVDLQAVGSVMSARLEHLQNHPEAAREAMHIAEKLAREHHLLPRCWMWVKYALARLWIAQGNFEKVSQLIQESGITANDEMPYLREPEYLALLRLLLAQGNYEIALTLSQRLLEKAEASRRTGRAIEVLVLQALIYQGRKEMAPSLAALKKALSLARPEGYVRTFLDEGEPLVRLLHLARSRQMETEYVTQLLSAIGEAASAAPSQSPAPGDHARMEQGLVEPLTGRELEVLRRIETGCSNQEIASQLVISIPTVKRHISNIYTKLGVSSRTQAIALGKELGLCG
jgi:LuxR family maltose regulon positive regulatory protein